jgi:diguanylate cyclase (GGDEF)-like protein/PAS domain S-box-containing protein
LSESATLPVIYWLLAVAAGTSTSILAILIWLRRPSRTANALGLYLFSVAIWSFGYGFELQASTVGERIFWAKVQYLGPAGVSLAGLIFVFQYTGLNEWARTSRIILLGIIPAITQILVWTNEKHGLIWRSHWLNTSGHFQVLERTHGPWFWVFLIYGYSLCLVGMLLLARIFFQRSGIYRSQAAVLLMGSAVPFIGNIIYSFGLGSLPHLDLTVFCFSVTGISTAWGLFRFQLPVIMPLARQIVLEGMSDGVIAVDLGGNVVEVNPEASSIFGRAATQLIGQPAATAFNLLPELVSLCEPPQEGWIELTIQRPDVERRFDVKSTLLKTRRERIIGSLIVLHDITDRKAAETALLQAHSVLEQRIAERTADLSRTIEELQQAENQLTYSACHDALTGLANRKLFLDMVTYRAETSRDRSDELFAIFYLDIDRFKVYNDGYGHYVGDLILVEIGHRLRSFFRSADTVARMGGDEFTILVANVENAAEASLLAQSCLEVLSRPSGVAGNNIQLTASLGIAISNNNQQRGADEMIRDADLAMYRAKRLGGNRTTFFGESMRSAALALVELEQDLHQALARGEMAVVYQPFVRIETGAVVGFEALIRWIHPRRGLLLPKEFLAVAEESGMLIAIDEFVLQEACRQKARWRSITSGDLVTPFVSVNLSGWQLAHPKWWDNLTALEGQTAGLRLEMLESVLIANAHAAVEFFDKVRAHNVHISLDDFGTGYSSLSWLSHFPIRSLKIDRSFVEGIATGDRDVSIVRAIIALARSLEMEVVAEGIQHERQCGILLDLGCEYGQGFYFSPPVDAQTALEIVRTQRLPTRVLLPTQKAFTTAHSA